MKGQFRMQHIDVVEMSISDMLRALEAGDLTSVDLVCASLNRIAYYDRSGLCLNAVPVLNPECLAEAAASDTRRAEGRAGALEGIPFTVKDSYKVAGLTVASGSPALKDLVATADAASVELLRAAGAVLLGKTNMPPMAAGGIQPGVYGYPRSPYNPQYITAAYGSGSSSGSATATTASFAAFGMAEETVSSGRAPASNNSLVAYTPSRGVLSIRGNWPLRPTCDVVVPHTRSVYDLLLLLDVLAVEDPQTTGDFWREQNAVAMPSPETVLPKPVARPRPARLDGLRLGIPRMYIGEDHDSFVPPVLRPSVRALWDQAAEDLRELGAEVIEVDFPVVSNYEEDRPGAQGPAARNLVPAAWRDIEGGTITAMALDHFLRDNGDPTLSSWADVDGDSVFPLADAPVPVWVTRARGGFDWQRFAELVKNGLPETYDDVSDISQLLSGLEELRRQDFEEWMHSLALDGVVFPAAGDVGRDDLFTRAESLEHASQNGVVYSNGNRVIRHLGIPTVTVPMGAMADTQMPVGLTFAGPSGGDDALLDHAWAYEQASNKRQRAYLTPSLPSNQIRVGSGRASSAPAVEHGPDTNASLTAGVTVAELDRSYEITVNVSFEGDGGGIHARRDASGPLQVWADGHILSVDPQSPEIFRGTVSKSRARLDGTFMILVKLGSQAASLQFAQVPGGS